MKATPIRDVLDVARGVISGDGWDADIGSGEPATQALAHALLDLFEQHQKLQSAAIRLCNVHRWSYGGPETLRALADRIAESYQMTFTHPETGEVLESREEILAAIKAHEDKMSPLFDVRYKLRTAYLESAEPADQPAARYRTPTQEKVARCPRCNGRLDAE